MAELQTETAVAGGRRTSPPFRADHVGSLLRPPELLKAREEFKAGKIDALELRAVEDDAIRDVVKLQHDVGLQSATDGEFRRASWHMDFIYQIGGISTAPGDIKVQFRNADGVIEWKPAALHVGEKLHLDHTIFGEDFQFLQGLVSGDVTPKLTIPSPSMVHYRGGTRSARSRRVSRRRPVLGRPARPPTTKRSRRLRHWAARYLQFDDTSLAYLNDPAQREQMANKGEDAEHLHEAYIRHINEALDGRPEGLTVTTHLCRGNFRSSWAAEGGYDFVAEALFGELDVDGFFLEYDDARSGGFEPLRFVPKNKLVVLGLVTTKRPELESKDLLKRRIEEATKYIAIEQLCLSGQCGFSSTVEGNALTRDEQIAKLNLIVETAAEVWG